MKDEYRKQIIDFVKLIDNEKRLKQLYTIAFRMHEKELKEEVQENEQWRI